MNNLPKVSILIPFYNHNHFIKKTLDSVIEDTYENKEIIIINDGSSNPDDSNILLWIKKNEKNIDIKYIKRENRGVTKTLNELISLSLGKYIVVCASDDYLINNTISKRVEILESNPDKLMLLSDNIVVNDNNEKLCDSNLFEFRNCKKEDYSNSTEIIKTFITKWSLAGACFMANKELYEVVGKYDESIIVEDWDFFLRTAAKKLILFYDERVSAYRLHDNNTINNPAVSEKMYLNQLYVTKKNMFIFSFVNTLRMIRRYFKFLIKIRKMKTKFPFNNSLWKEYKYFKQKNIKSNKAIKQVFLKKIILNKRDNKTFDIKQVERVLITRYDRIGDMLFTFPLIEIIKKHYPEIKIDIYASSTNYDLVKVNPYVNKVYVNEPSHRFRSFKTLLNLRKNRYDLILDMYENRLSNTLIRMFFLNGKYTAGMDKYRKHGFSYDDLKGFYLKIFGKDKSKHIIDKNLEFLEIFDIKNKNYSKEVFIKDEYKCFYDTYIKKDKYNILFNTEGSAKSRILTLLQINEILSGFNFKECNIIIVALDEQYNILKDKINKEVQLVNVNSIFQTISIIKKTDLVISPDTAIIHFASMFDKKIIGIYSLDENNYLANKPFSKDYKVVRSTSKENRIKEFNTKKVIEFANEYIK